MQKVATVFPLEGFSSGLSRTLRDQVVQADGENLVRIPRSCLHSRPAKRLPDASTSLGSYTRFDQFSTYRPMVAPARPEPPRVGRIFMDVSRTGRTRIRILLSPYTWASGRSLPPW
jgi:hypothetical protein